MDPSMTPTSVEPGPPPAEGRSGDHNEFLLLRPVVRLVPWNMVNQSRINSARICPEILSMDQALQNQR